MKIIVSLPPQHAGALREFAADNGGSVQVSHDETVLTADGEEIHLYDIERFYRNNLPHMEFVNELLDEGWSLKPWEEVDDIEAAALGQLVNFFSQGPDFLSPEWYTPFHDNETVKTALADFLIPLQDQS